MIEKYNAILTKVWGENRNYWKSQVGNDYFKKLPNIRNGGHVPGRPGKVPGRSRTGPRDPEGPGTKMSRDLRSPKVLGHFLKVPGLPGLFFPLHTKSRRSKKERKKVWSCKINSTKPHFTLDLWRNRSKYFCMQKKIWQNKKKKQICKMCKKILFFFFQKKKVPGSPRKSGDKRS